MPRKKSSRKNVKPTRKRCQSCRRFVNGAEDFCPLCVSTDTMENCNTTVATTDAGVVNDGPNYAHESRSLRRIATSHYAVGKDAEEHAVGKDEEEHAQARVQKRKKKSDTVPGRSQQKSRTARGSMEDGVDTEAMKVRGIIADNGTDIEAMKACGNTIPEEEDDKNSGDAGRKKTNDSSLEQCDSDGNNNHETIDMDICYNETIDMDVGYDLLSTAAAVTFAARNREDEGYGLIGTKRNGDVDREYPPPVPQISITGSSGTVQVDNLFLTGPLFKCCENCHRWSCEERDMEELDYQLVSEKNCKEMRSNRDDLSLQSDDAVVNIRHDFTVKGGDNFARPIDVVPHKDSLEITTLVKLQTFRWLGQFCFVDKPKSIKSGGQPWHESMDLCRQCREYITGRFHSLDEFPNVPTKTKWTSQNHEYGIWRNFNKKEWYTKNNRECYWPARLWILLCDERVVKIQTQLLWSMLPMVMRGWWHESIIRRKAWIFCPGGKLKPGRARMKKFRQLKYDEYIQESMSVLADVDNRTDLYGDRSLNRIIQEEPYIAYNFSGDGFPVLAGCYNGTNSYIYRSLDTDLREETYDAYSFIDGHKDMIAAICTEQSILDVDMLCYTNTEIGPQMSMGYCKGFDLDKYCRQNNPSGKMYSPDNFISTPPCGVCPGHEKDPYFGCSYECPPPMFVDRSIEYLECLKCRDLNVAPSLVHFFDNHHSICDVKCPFGCTSFLSKCGSVDFETIIIRYMSPYIDRQATSESISKRNQVKHDSLVGARNDFLSHNGSWLPQPKSSSIDIDQSISRVFLMTRQGPRVATCEYHDKGSKHRYLHPPMNPATGSLPSRTSSQLAHTVMVPRTVKSMRAHTYNTTYEVRECNGNYKGIDSCDVSDNGNLNLSSPVHDTNLLLTVHYRKDIIMLLQRLVKNGVISQSFAQECVQGAEALFEQTAVGGAREDIQAVHDEFSSPVDQALEGATSISFVDSISLERILTKSSSCRDLRRFSETDKVLPHKEFIPRWAPSFIWVHPCDAYGSRPLRIPEMRGVKDTYWSYGAWLTVNIVSNFAEVYELFFDSTRNERLCHGWFLRYYSDHVNRLVSQGKYDKDNKAELTADNEKVFPPYQWKKLYEYLGMVPRSVREKTSAGLIGLLKKCFLVENIPGQQNPVDLFTDVVLSANPQSRPGTISVCHFHPNDPVLHLDAPAHCEIVILRRKSDPRNTAWYYDTITVNENTYRARYLSYRIGHDDISREHNQMRAVTFLRHREIDYTSWWCTERHNSTECRSQEPYPAKYYGGNDNEDASIYGSSGLPLEAVNSWEVLVYIRTKNEMQKLIRESFEAMGGNPNVKCEAHGTILVDSAARTKHKCSFQVACNRRSSFECPFDCTSRICKRHLDEQLSLAAGKDIIVPPVACDNAGEINADDSDNLDDGSGSENTDAIIADREAECRNNCADDSDNEDGRNATNSNDSDEDSCSNRTDSMFVDIREDDDSSNFYDNSGSEDGSTADNMNLFTSQTAFEVPDDVSMSDMFLTDPMTNVPTHDTDEQEFDNNELIIPSTSAAIPGFGCRIYARNGRKIGAHVIYNSKGQCLQRNNNKLTMSKYEKGMMLGIISTTNDATPISYIEASMFPNIFWKGNKDGSSVGSLTGPLWTDQRKAASVNIAGYQDHVRARVSNPAIGTSGDPRYIFQCFDILQNISLRGTDDRTVLHRGLREHNPGLCVVNEGKAQHNVHSCDVIDSRKSVNCLSSQLRDNFPTYFITMTCNMKEFPSMEQLHKIKTAILNCIDDECDVPTAVKKDIRRSIESLAAVQCTRTWQICIETILKYITESSDEVLGKFLGHFARLEHQESEYKASGTNSHLHLIGFVDVDHDSEEDTATMYNRIRGSSDTLFLSEDVSKLIAQGIITDEAEADELREKSRIIQVHCCEKCGGRCLRSLPDGSTVCRYTDYAKENPNKVYGFILIQMKHSEKATAILIELNFLEKGPDGEITVIDRRFEAGKHVYPADYGEHFSPTNPVLFALTRSDCNVVVCGRYMVARYLAKYVASIDEVARVDIRSRPGTHGDLEIKVTPLHNTKITSSRMAADAQLQKREKNKPHSRIIGLPEVIGHIFNSRTVFCSRKFIHVTTVSLENRPAVITGKLNIGDPTKTPVEITGTSATFQPIAGTATTYTVAPAIAARRKFERNADTQWRQFTRPQQLQIADNLETNISTDAVTNYSVRDPVLLFLNNYTDYSLFFMHDNLPRLNVDDTKLCGEMAAVGNNGGNMSSFFLSEDVTKSLWINGFEKHTRIRPPALAIVLEKYSDRLMAANEDLFILFHALFFILRKGTFAPSMDLMFLSQRNRTKNLSLKIGNNLCDFVDLTYADKLLPLPLFSSVKPSNATKFFVHVLLSMGVFDTEYELWQVTSVRSAFERAGLLRGDATEEELEEDLKSLCIRYVSEQLLFVPAGTRQFDFFLCEAKKVLTSIFNTGSLPAYKIPACLHTTIEASLSRSIVQLKDDVKINMIRAVRQQIPSLPSENDFLACSRGQPLDKLRVSYSFLDDQSVESKQEQKGVFDLLTETVDLYASGQISDNNNVILHGSPGTGKTHMAMLSIAYALGQGLSCVSMALLCERALLLGGMHYHKFTKMTSVHNINNIHGIADGCIQRMKKDALMTTFIRSLDVIFIDEMGQLSAEQVSILDILLRYVRKTEAYLGGILLICAMDLEQLGAIEGHPFLMCSNIIVSYRIVDFQHYVRCRTDRDSQLLCELCRRSSITQEEREQFIHLIITKCNFVPNMDDESIPDDALRILGTHKGADTAEARFIAKLKIKDAKGVIEAHSVDTMSSRSIIDQWTPANEITVKALNRNSQVHEPQILYFYCGAVMEFTHNRPNYWSQGQLCICTDVPDGSNINEANHKIMVYAAPVGTKTAPDAKDEQTLIQMGWKKIYVERRKRMQKINVGNNVFADRGQFPLHSRVAATIHRAMGSSLKNIVTEISKSRNHCGYLWDRGQVVVLLSRTPALRNMYFVQQPDVSKREIAETLLNILARKPSYYNQMKEIIDRIGIRFCPVQQAGEIHDQHAPALPRILTLDNFPFRPMDMVLPDNNISFMGFCYVLLSLKNRSSIYIGACNDVAARLKQHNTGYSSATNKIAPSQLQPWALIGFVCGFDHKNQKFVFEKNWQGNVRDILRRNACAEVVELIQVGKDMIIDRVETMPNLRYQACAKLNYEPNSSSGKEMVLEMAAIAEVLHN